MRPSPCSAPPGNPSPMRRCRPFPNSVPPRLAPTSTPNPQRPHIGRIGPVASGAVDRSRLHGEIFDKVVPREIRRTFPYADAIDDTPAPVPLLQSINEAAE